MSSVAPRPLLFERCEARHLDEVMPIMTSAFSHDFGEAWTRSQCAGILPMAGVMLFLARDPEDRVARGFLLLRTVADEAELLLIAVAPGAQRRGIGRALLDHFVAFARGWGASRLHLEVREGNDAIGLYRAAGFEIAGRRTNYYRGASGQHDALTLVLASNQS
ncbi:MAG: GNAT family N-acetyltransferase [Sphingomicrobium sp.]